MATSTDKFGEIMDNIEKLKSLCLSKTGAIMLERSAILKNLATYLKSSGINALEQNNIKLLPMASPMSLFWPPVEIPAVSYIIVLDINSLRELSGEEMTVMTLHEIGHVVHPGGNTLTREISADEYVCNFGMGKELLSSLEERIISQPRLYPKEITEKRIEAIRRRLNH